MMKNTSKKNALIWFSSAGLFFYVEGFASLMFFSFADDTVRYLDVFDELKFVTRLEEFLKQNNIQSVDIHFIVGQDTLIENEFQKGNDELINQFLINIPYEEVYSKKTVKENSVHVAAFNGEIFQIIRSILEKFDCTVKTVLPYYLLPQERLDINNVIEFIKKSISLKSESMVTLNNTDDNNYTEQPVNNEANGHKEKSSLPVLIPVFILLLLVLGAVVYLAR